MKENAVNVLKEQLAKLDAKKFDLSAWKESTILLLDKIFGKGNEKTEHIQRIKYDQGSWVLRDETGYTNSLEACKKLGHEILDAAILELENFGVPDTTIQTVALKVLVEALEDELTGSQLKEIKKALTEKVSIEDKKKVIMTKLKGFGQDAALAVLAKILTQEEVSRKLTSP